MVDAHELAGWVRDARQHTVALIEDLDDNQLLGARLDVVNPLLWEIGHVAWFQEKWVLRHACGQPPLRDSDTLYDSAAIPHDTRWDLLLPSRRETLSYLRAVHDRVQERLARKPSPEEIYFIQLSMFHEDMHTEAFVQTRQTLAYPACLAVSAAVRHRDSRRARPRSDGLVHVPGGTFLLGADRREPFVFDNEKWAHAVEVLPFALARTAVTQEEFAAFVEAQGYARQEFWSTAGWDWRTREAAEHPVYWRRASQGSWERRAFERWLPLEPTLPMVHVNWYEAEAYCRWAGRRLPTELEWEVAAAAESAGQALTPLKRRFPWGDTPPTPERARLDGLAEGCGDVDDLPAGDSALGCRQMIGNVWEWTASSFLPYPGFVADPYQEYSQPWFGTHKVLRGGCWATRARLLRNTWRNFYRPQRRDVFAGFRTCAS